MSKKKQMNADDVMSSLSDVVSSIKLGKMNPKTASIIIGSTGKMLSCAKAKVQYQKLAGKKPDVSFFV